MEAALCLGYGPLPSTSLRPPSTTNITAPISTKLRFGFNHSSISVSTGFSKGRKCHHLYTLRGPLALDRSNNYNNNNSMPCANEGGGKVVRGAVGASLALACALSIIGCGCKMNFRAIAAGPRQVFQKAPSIGRDFAPTPPRKMALEPLLNVTKALATRDATKVNEGGARMIPEDIAKLKEVAVSLMTKGQADLALEMLQNEHRKYKSGDSAYNMSLVLAEIFILKGEYEEALKYIPQPISEFDARPTLYKAIICTMLNDETEAQMLWKQFAKQEVFSPFGLH